MAAGAIAPAAADPNPDPAPLTPPKFSDPSPRRPRAARPEPADPLSTATASRPRGHHVRWLPASVSAPTTGSNPTSGCESTPSPSTWTAATCVPTTSPPARSPNGARSPSSPRSTTPAVAAGPSRRSTRTSSTSTRPARRRVPESGRKNGPLPGPGVNRAVGIGPQSAGRVLELYFEGSLTLPSGQHPRRVQRGQCPAGGVGAYTSAWGSADRALTVDAAAPVAEAVVRDGRAVSVTDSPGSGPVPEGATVLVGREAGRPC
ncbi:hypothetical protein NKH18_03835 [Streptomyces sp. M10(2022)]